MSIVDGRQPRLLIPVIMGGIDCIWYECSFILRGRNFFAALLRLGNFCAVMQRIFFLHFAGEEFLCRGLRLGNFVAVTLCTENLPCIADLKRSKSCG